MLLLEGKRKVDVKRWKVTVNVSVFPLVTASPKPTMLYLKAK